MKESVLRLPGLALLPGAAAGSVTQPPFFTWIQMTEYCQISCYLVNYSLGSLILCWDNCTHLALCVLLWKPTWLETTLPSQSIQLHVSVSHRCFPAAACMHLKPKSSFTTLPTSWLYIKVHGPVYVPHLTLIPQLEGDDCCLTILTMKSSLPPPHHLALVLLQRRAELK